MGLNDIEVPETLVAPDVCKDDFLKALDVLGNVKGKVAVTGMGKSGHIARKVAATLSSTGQPSYFIHPGEASHGDLGMIGPDDAIIAYSNSGETKELSDLINYSKRLQIPLIAITKASKSSLAHAATCHITLPDVPEACPLRLAPTTSTTMMLVVGDVIALSLLEMRGFSPHDYSVFHPGGSLGRKLKKVSESMRVGLALPLVNQNTDMSTAIIEMSTKRIGCVGVLDDDGKLIGIFTDGDLRRCIGRNFFDQPIKDLMTPNPVTIADNTLMSEALTILNEKRITVLFIVSELKPVGIIHVHDFLKEGII